MRPSFPRALAAGAAVTMALFGAAAPAFAHVTANSDQAVQGGFAKITFRVPNERDDASTSTVDVQLPAEHPLGFVSVKPHPGWTFTVTRAKLTTPISTGDGQVTDYVSEIVWTASPGSEIGPGQFEEFDISAGPLPTADSMEFKALQTYSDGQVVRWIEESGADGKEPDHPAPVLKLGAAAADGGDHHADSGASATTAAPGTSVTTPIATVSAVSESDVDSAKGIGIAGIVVGAVGVVVGGLGLARGRGPAA